MLPRAAAASVRAPDAADEPDVHHAHARARRAGWRRSGARCRASARARGAQRSRLGSERGRGGRGERGGGGARARRSARRARRRRRRARRPARRTMPVARERASATRRGGGARARATREAPHERASDARQRGADERDDAPPGALSRAFARGAPRRQPAAGARAVLKPDRARRARRRAAARLRLGPRVAAPPRASRPRRARASIASGAPPDRPLGGSRKRSPLPALLDRVAREGSQQLIDAGDPKPGMGDIAKTVGVMGTRSETTPEVRRASANAGETTRARRPSPRDLAEIKNASRLRLLERPAPRRRHPTKRPRTNPHRTFTPPLWFPQAQDARGGGERASGGAHAAAVESGGGGRGRRRGESDRDANEPTSRSRSRG